MLRRFISAFVLIGILVSLLWLDFHLGSANQLGRAGLVLSLASIVLAGLAAAEFCMLWSRPETVPGSISESSSQGETNLRGSRQLVVICASALMIAIACIWPAWMTPLSQLTTSNSAAPSPLLFTMMGLVVALFLTFVAEMWHFAKEPHQHASVTDRLSRAALVYLYLATLFGFLIPHRHLEGNNALGLVSIIAMIATVKMSDSFALFVGKAFGTTKLAPRLSPGKTIQGTLGAFLGGGLAAGIVFFLVAPSLFGIRLERPWWWFAAYVIALTTAGIFGDLAESMLKRDVNQKDSSSKIPGLGGILDVLDSLIFACPMSYLLWTI